MRQKKQKLYLYFILLSAFLISNCGTNNVTNVNPIPSSIISTEQSTRVEIDRPTLSPKPDWLVRWLNEPVCQPPCWEKITPGKTSFTDALAIAKRISGFDVDRVNNDSIQLFSTHNGANDLALLLTQGDANIQVVGLDTSFTSLGLGEIVDRYGFPDEMIKKGFPSTEFSSVSIDLLYYDLGMVISFYALPSDPWNKVRLGPDTSIASISFFAPQLKYYFNTPPVYGSNVSPAIKLNGYGVYDTPEGTCNC